MRIKQSSIRAALLAGSPDPKQLAEEDHAWLPGYRKPREKRNEKPEEALQLLIVEYLCMYPDILFFHPLQNMWRGKNSNEGAFLHYMGRMKRLGHKPGIPDLILFFKNKHGAAVSVFLELKTGYNQLTEAQVSIHEQANNAGCYTCVARSVGEVRKLLRDVGHVRHQNGISS